MHCFTSNEWIQKNFEDGGKNISFKIADDDVFLK